MVSAIMGLFALHTYYRLSTIHCNTMQHEAKQYSTRQQNTAQYRTTQFSTIQIRTIDYSAIQCSKMPFPLLVICHLSVICGSVEGGGGGVSYLRVSGVCVWGGGGQIFAGQ